MAILAIKAIPAIAASWVSHAFHQVSPLRVKLFKGFRESFLEGLQNFPKHIKVANHKLLTH
jgi:hypothetical protein